MKHEYKVLNTADEPNDSLMGWRYLGLSNSGLAGWGTKEGPSHYCDLGDVEGTSGKSTTDFGERARPATQPATRSS